MKRKSIEMFERDNLVADIIFSHKGRENAIGTRELAHILSENGYSVDVYNLRSIVQKVLYERHLPICSIQNGGYYWATSKQDIEASIASLEVKIDSLKRRVELLKSFIYE